MRCWPAAKSHEQRQRSWIALKRCAAPCVGRISEDDYATLVAQAKAFLSGRTAAVQQNLAAGMEQAAEALEFEKAAEATLAAVGDAEARRTFERISQQIAGLAGKDAVRLTVSPIPRGAGAGMLS